MGHTFDLKTLNNQKWLTGNSQTWHTLLREQAGQKIFLAHLHI